MFAYFPMPIKANGVRYLAVTDLLKEVDATRQAIWQWRQERKVPAGHWYRSQQVIFSPEEVGVIRKYANRIEPIKDKVGTSSNEVKIMVENKPDEY